jgi:hypothetical protein
VNKRKETAAARFVRAAEENRRLRQEIEALILTRDHLKADLERSETNVTGLRQAIGEGQLYRHVLVGPDARNVAAAMLSLSIRFVQAEENGVLTEVRQP